MERENRQRIVALRDGYEARLRAIIQHGIDEGVFSAAEAKLATFLVLGALTGVLGWYDPTRPWRPETIAEHHTALLLEGLRAS